MFNIHEKFKLDTMFPGTPVSKGIGSSTPPDTVTSKIENGLTVASQEMPGLMSTFALIVRCGRYLTIPNYIYAFVFLKMGRC